MEDAVLACIIADNSLIHRATGSGLVSEHFLGLRRSKLYGVLLGMQANGQDIDLISLTDELRSRDLLDQIGGLDTLVGLDNWFPDTTHFGEYVERTKAGGVRQRVMDVGRRFANLPPDVATTTDIMANVSSGFEEISGLAKGNNRITTAEQSVNDLVTELENPQWGRGVMSGFVGLDALTGGFGSQSLIIVAGRPGMGKTALAVNMLVNHARNGEAGGIFSLEMSQQELMVRILSETSGVPSAAMRAQALTQHDWNAISKARQKVSKYKLWIEDSGALGIDDLCGQAVELVRNEGLSILVVDYLQLINLPPRGTRNDEVAYGTRRLKQLAMELKIPVVLLSQLSRKPEGRPDKRPSLADLRDSGAIEQDADVVVFVYRPGYYLEQSGKPDDTQGVTELLVQKNRHGQAGTTRVMWQPDTTSFVDV